MKEYFRPLKRISDDPRDAERLEAKILELFRLEIFSPLLILLQLPDSTLVENAKHTPLMESLRLGRVAFNRGVFSGKFDAATSKELKALGATWDRKTAAWRLPLAKVPDEIQQAIAVSEARFVAKLEQLDRILLQKLPAEIADHLDATKVFDITLWKTDRAMAKSLKSIAVPPDLTPERRERIAAEWHDNLALPIKDFAEKEIQALRDLVQKHTFSGGRYEELTDRIKKQYGVTARKAKFLARQETSLLVTKFKETRYTDAGVTEYRWVCVKGSPAHPVRPSHKALDGKIFRWDHPPITTAPDEPPRRNNPGQDFNCRCTAIPLVRLRSS